MMNLPTIAIIGGGNMGGSLIGGLIKHGHLAINLYVSDTDEQKLAELQHKYGVHTSTDNAAIVAAAEVIIFAIKPQLMAETIKPLASHLRPQQLLISIAAGVPAASIDRWAGAGFAVSDNDENPDICVSVRRLCMQITTSLPHNVTLPQRLCKQWDSPFGSMMSRKLIS